MCIRDRPCPPGWCAPPAGCGYAPPPTGPGPTRSPTRSPSSGRSPPPADPGFAPSATTPSAPLRNPPRPRSAAPTQFSTGRTTQTDGPTERHRTTITSPATAQVVRCIQGKASPRRTLANVTPMEGLVRKHSKQRTAAVAIAAAVLALLPGSAGAQAPPAQRLAGSNRYATAAAVSAATFAEGVDVAFIATGENFPDALAGGPLAGSRGAPVLLTGRDALPAETAAELDRLEPASEHRDARAAAERAQRPVPAPQPPDVRRGRQRARGRQPVSYTHLRAHETD